MGKEELIHTRNIRINSFETGEGTLRVEGTLTDERPFPSRLYSADEDREPGVVHDMTVSMTLSIPRLKILSVDALMSATPIAGCEEISSSVKRLEGMTIKSGFTNKVKTALGKTQGCLHLTNLILIMSSAAVQGAWAYFSRKRADGKARAPETDQTMIIDSCWMWRKEGPLASKFTRMTKEMKHEPEGK